MNTIVGFSANAELLIEWDPNSSATKIPATRWLWNLAGTSANVVNALKVLGHDASLLALTGSSPSPERSLFEALLNHSGLQYETFPVLNGVSQALQPVTGSETRIVSKKAPIQSELMTLAMDAIERLTSGHHGWRIATGFPTDQLCLVEALLGQHKGSRIVNPRSELLAHSQAIDELLKVADFLICNEDEFISFVGGAAGPEVWARHLDAVHDRGVQLVVVTMNSRGAYASFRGKRFHVPAFKVGKVASEIGAGDWWLAGFLTLLLESGFTSLDQVDYVQVLASAQFASVVAGIKVTRLGTFNGPSRAEADEMHRAVTYAI